MNYELQVSPFVANEAQFLELVHEEIDPTTICAHQRKLLDSNEFGVLPFWLVGIG